MDEIIFDEGNNYGQSKSPQGQNEVFKINLLRQFIINYFPFYFADIF